MRAIDLDLRKDLEFRPERGELRLYGERMLLLGRATLQGFYELLGRDLGVEQRRAFLMQLGQRWGAEAHATLLARHTWDTEHDHLVAGAVAQMWQGVVHAEATTVELDRARGHFLLRGIWRNSFEAELHRQLGAATAGESCWCLCGHASGWASAFFGQPLLAIETACVTTGAPHCTFEIRPEAAFGAEADRFRRALGIAPAAPPTTAVQLREVVDRAAASVEALARAKGLAFFVTSQDSDGPPPQLLGDAAGIEAVVANLCAAAIAETEGGAVVVTVKMPAPGRAGRWQYAVEVNDTGPGLPPEQIAARSAEAARAIEAARQGTQKLGGAMAQLTVDNLPEQGTTFRFSFDAEPVATALRPLRVLLVEDADQGLRAQLAGLAEVTAVPAAEAPIALREPFDLIFVDLAAAGDGPALPQALRALPLSHQPYVVAVTATPAPRQRDRCLSAGFDDFATRPLSRESLQALLRHVSDGLRGERAPAIDGTALQALGRNLDSELLGELLTTFLRDAGELVARFVAADEAEARRAAHSLKSTALAVGARPLAAIAAAAERGQPAAAADRARAELSRVEDALRAARG